MNKSKDKLIRKIDDAFGYWEKNEKSKALQVLERIKDTEEIMNNIRLHLLLGNLYSEKEDFVNSFFHFKTATNLDRDSELSSLCLYIVLVKLNKESEAIKEMTRFLSSHAAKSYRVTLKELLGELKKGNATKYKSKILKFAELNKLKIPNYIR